MDAEICKKWQSVAVIDGCGDHAEVTLYLEADDDFQELPWPEDWPSWVSTEFLEAKGFEVRNA